MTTWFEYLERSKPMGDVIPFERPKTPTVVEHVDSSTIVERLELTPELQAEFEKAGYTFDKDEAS